MKKACEPPSPRNCEAPPKKQTKTISFSLEKKVITPFHDWELSFCFDVFPIPVSTMDRRISQLFDSYRWPWQGTLILIQKGEGSLTGLTSCAYRIYWLGLSSISARSTFSLLSKQPSLNEQVQEVRRTGYFPIYLEGERSLAFPIQHSSILLRFTDFEKCCLFPKFLGVIIGLFPHT